jgi:uncharacterized membrane-anchored protein
MDTSQSAALSKVPAITLGFWTIKILATTFGETAGDTVSMSWLGEATATAGQGGLNGYLVGTAIFLSLLVVMVTAQIRARRFYPHTSAWRDRGRLSRQAGCKRQS